MDPRAPAADEQRLLDEAIAALAGQRQALGDEVVDAALRPLLDRRDRLHAASVGEQRKLVTVLFADLVDSTATARGLDPEDWQQVISRYFAGARAAVEAEGGVVEKFIGDAVMAVFGLYRAREDDAHRAVRAALVLRGAVEQLSAQVEPVHGVRLQVRVGLDTGEVLVTALEQRAAGELLVVGDASNRAARLQAAAPPGGILLSADTHRQVRGSFGVRAVPRLHLKGIATPVDGYLVVSGEARGFWPETRGVEGVVTRTVGRDRELARLRALLVDVLESGAWHVVTVLGDAGVGKSRLVHDFDAWLGGRQDDVRVLRGRASPSTVDVPHALLRSMFAERLGIDHTDAPGEVRRKWREGAADVLGATDDADRAAAVLATWLGFAIGDVPQAPGWTADPEALGRRAGALLLDVLAAYAGHAPVVLLLEDLHWADSASLDWLQDLPAARRDHPLLVIATARPTLLERRADWGAATTPSHSRFRLEPLSAADSRGLVAEILQRAEEVPDVLVDVLVDAAEGNPFYLEELVKWLTEEGVITAGAGRWSIAAQSLGTLRVPSTLRSLLQARLDSLEATDRAVLGCAAVVGRVFWDGAVARLSDRVPEPARDGGLQRLAEREVVFPRPRSTFRGTREYSFRHALMRDVVYDGVVRSVRRRHHALAARWLEEVAEQSQRPEEHAAAVAQHHEAAGESAAAAAWYLRAGRHAGSSFAGDDALRLLTRAEALAPRDDTAMTCQVLLARVTVLDRLGRRDEQRATLDRLGVLCQGLPEEHRAEVRLAEARWLFSHGEYRAMSPVSREAARLARQAGRVDLEAEALVQAGRSLEYASEHAAARAALRQALALARRVGDHRRAAESLRQLAIVATNVADSDEALALLTEARDEHRLIDDREGEALVTGQLGALLINLGRLEDARAASQDALAVFVETGHRLREGVVRGNLVTVAMEEGRLDEALEQAVATLRLTREIDDPEGVVSSLQRLGDVHRLTGDLRAARECLEGGLTEGRRSDLPYFTAHLLSSLVAVDLTEGRIDEALAHAAAAREAAGAADVPHAAARAELVTGLALSAADAPEAADVLSGATGTLADLGMVADRVEGLAALAVVLLRRGDAAAALAVADSALSQLDAQVPPGAVEPGRVLVDLHRVLRAAGDPRAGDVARRAGSYLAERAGRIRDRDLRERFLATGVNVDLARVAVSTAPAEPAAQASAGAAPTVPATSTCCGPAPPPR